MDEYVKTKENLYYVTPFYLQIFFALPLITFIYMPGNDGLATLRPSIVNELPDMPSSAATRSMPVSVAIGNFMPAHDSTAGILSTLLT